MTDALPSVLAPLLAGVSARGFLLVLPSRPRGLLRSAKAAADASGVEVVEVDGPTAGMTAGGVVDGMGEGFLRGGDDGFCEDAAGSGEGALDAWERIRAGAAPEADPEDFEAALRTDAAVRARVLAAIGDLAPRVAILRRPEACDDASARALRSLLLGGTGAGWGLITTSPESGPLVDVFARLAESAADERIPAAAYREIPGPDVGEAETVVARAPAEGPAPAQAPPELSEGPGELLAILSAAPLALPAEVVGAAALSAYRGRAPRAGWSDLQGLVDAKAASLSDGRVRVKKRAPGAPLVRKADARALLAAAEEVLPAAPGRGRLLALLAGAGGGDVARSYAVAAADEALALGEAEAAERLLRALPPSSAPAARARAAALRGDHAAAQRHAEAADGLDALWEAATATWAMGRLSPARARFEALAQAAEGQGEDEWLGAARYAEGCILEEEGDFVGAARVHGDAAKAFDRAADDVRAARAFARRAVAMAKAGAPDRAVRELRLAMERAADLDDPRPAALDVRILVGVVFREAASRDKARMALGLAAEKAEAHAAPDREAEARLLAGRFHLEGMPARGAERGEALRDGREAAEAAVRIARGAGLTALEAEAEAVLGQLAWRAEDWSTAAASLDRQATLWARASRPGKEVAVAIQRGRLAGRQGDWETAFRAAVSALTTASKRRLREQVAQSQLLRGEALQKLDRASEALEAFAEAQRVYSSLGEGFEAQARAAERRAREAIAGKG